MGNKKDIIRSELRQSNVQHELRGARLAGFDAAILQTLITKDYAKYGGSRSINDLARGRLDGIAPLFRGYPGGLVIAAEMGVDEPKAMMTERGKDDSARTEVARLLRSGADVPLDLVCEAVWRKVQAAEALRAELAESKLGEELRNRVCVVGFECQTDQALPALLQVWAEELGVPLEHLVGMFNDSDIFCFKFIRHRVLELSPAIWDEAQSATPCEVAVPADLLRALRLDAQAVWLDASGGDYLTLRGLGPALALPLLQGGSDEPTWTLSEFCKRLLAHLQQLRASSSQQHHEWSGLLDALEGVYNQPGMVSFYDALLDALRVTLHGAGSTLMHLTPAAACLPQALQDAARANPAAPLVPPTPGNVAAGQEGSSRAAGAARSSAAAAATAAPAPAGEQPGSSEAECSPAALQQTVHAAAPVQPPTPGGAAAGQQGSSRAAGSPRVAPAAAAAPAPAGGQPGSSESECLPPALQQAAQAAAPVVPPTPGSEAAGQQGSSRAAGSPRAAPAAAAAPVVVCLDSLAPNSPARGRFAVLLSPAFTESEAQERAQELSAGPQGLAAELARRRGEGEGKEAELNLGLAIRRGEVCVLPAGGGRMRVVSTAVVLALGQESAQQRAARAQQQLDRDDEAAEQMAQLQLELAEAAQQEEDGMQS